MTKQKRIDIFFCATLSTIMSIFEIKSSDIQLYMGKRDEKLKYSVDSINSWRTRCVPGRIAVVECLAEAIVAWLNDNKSAVDYSGKHLINELKQLVKERLDQVPEFLQDSSNNDVCLIIKNILLFGYGLKKGIVIEAKLDKSKTTVVNDDADSKAEKAGTTAGNVESKEETTGKIKTKIVVFDFDGTLTRVYNNNTTWLEIWTKLGYEASECKKLHEKYNKKIFDHAEWCLQTEKKFKEKGLHKKLLTEIAKGITLMQGIKEVLESLKEKDIKVYIVSGSIKCVIQDCLGPLTEYITGGIDANEFLFDEDGYLERIVGTEYDFEGKKTRIEGIIEKYGIAPKQVLFVGNSYNDEWAHASGARTLLINPRQTSNNDREKWHDCIEKCKSLEEINDYIW